MWEVLIAIIVFFLSLYVLTRKPKKLEGEFKERVKEGIFKNKKIASWYFCRENFKLMDFVFDYYLRGNTGLVEGSTFSRLLAKGIPRWEVLSFIMKSREADLEKVKRLIQVLEDFRVKEKGKWVWFVLILDRVEHEVCDFVEKNEKWEIGLVLVDLKRKKFFKNKNLISKPLEKIVKKVF